MASGPLQWLGKALARYLSEPRVNDLHVSTSRPDQLAGTLQKGDVLLVEGSSRFSTAICYLTQSTWSHAALCIGSAPDDDTDDGGLSLVEADINQGVRTVSVRKYVDRHTRICRPVGLDANDIDRVARYALGRVGNRYDLRNIVDLARYLISTPPVPNSMRRQMLSLGSGDPTRAICSLLIAEAFASVHYPVLPDIEVIRRRGPDGRCQAREILHIRHSSLYMPRDFDVSPYFQIIKPTLASGFDPHQLAWAAAEIRNLPPCD